MRSSICLYFRHSNQQIEKKKKIEEQKKHPTCVSVTPSSFASSDRSEDDKYFLHSNWRSNSNICRPVKVVRAFFRFLSALALPLSEYWDSFSLGLGETSEGEVRRDKDWESTLEDPLRWAEMWLLFSFLIRFCRMEDVEE